MEVCTVLLSGSRRKIGVVAKRIEYSEAIRIATINNCELVWIKNNVPNRKRRNVFFSVNGRLYNIVNHFW